MAERRTVATAPCGDRAPYAIRRMKRRLARLRRARCRAGLQFSFARVYLTSGRNLLARTPKA